MESLRSPRDRCATRHRAWHGRAHERRENRVLFIDGEAIVIDKPAGLAVHAGPSTREASRTISAIFASASSGRRSPVHRLDRDTSGCLLLARNPKAHKRFARAFEEGRSSKTYSPCSTACPTAEEGVIDLALAKISSRGGGLADGPRSEGKPR